jgi:hypothetical protein
VGEFGSEGRDFGKEEFTFYTSGVRVVKYGPYGYLLSASACSLKKSAYKILELSSCLLNDTILSF